MTTGKPDVGNLAWALQHVGEHGFGDLVDADSVIEEAARSYLAATGGVHVRILQENQVVADLPAWPHQIPARGDYIFHPPYGPGGQENIAGCVRTVTWRTHDRPAEPGTGFVQTASPYVELVI